MNIHTDDSLAPGYIVLIVTCSVLLVLFVIVVLSKYCNQPVAIEPRNVSSFDNPVYNGQAEQDALKATLYKSSFIDSENEEGYQDIGPDVISQDVDYLDVNPPSNYSDNSVYNGISQSTSDL